MDTEDLRSYCLQKKGAAEGFPFGSHVLVLTVLGKVFAMINLVDIPLRMNLKCDPALALELRERYAAVIPGYHSNKKHWNTIIVDGSIPQREIVEMMDHSYAMVVQGLKRSDRALLDRI